MYGHQAVLGQKHDKIYKQDNFKLKRLGILCVLFGEYFIALPYALNGLDFSLVYYPDSLTLSPLNGFRLHQPDLRRNSQHLFDILF
jgi:hypothetical protein